jgi:hypothetical protein
MKEVPTMLSRTLTADAVAPPALRRCPAAGTRPRATSPAIPSARTAEGAAGTVGGATFVREPYAQNQKFAQFSMYVHFAQMTRIAPPRSGALGSHPARDPV